MQQPAAMQLFEILVREHARELDLFLRGAVRDPALAEDLFQETLLVAWRRLPDFDRRRPFGPWLRGIAGRLALAARGKKHGIVVDDEQVLAGLERRCSALHSAPGDSYDDRITWLEECLDLLPERMRSALRLRYAEGERGSELATRLQTTTANARKILERARRQLSACLEQKLAAWGES